MVIIYNERLKMAKEFVNHHVHSHFSALDGLSKPHDIIDRVVEMGQRSVSITDHGNMSAIPEMYRRAQESGIGFTPGIEAYFAKDRFYHKEDRLGEKYYHMILLAYNNQGYQNLVKLQTPSWEEGYYYKPRLDYDLLEQYHEGLTVTTACLGGIVNQHLLRGNYDGAKKELATLVDIFGKEHVYVEIQKGSQEKESILDDQVKLAKEMGLGLLPTADSHYTLQSDHDYHDTLLCCSTISTKDNPNRFAFDSDNYHLHSSEEMAKLFPHHEFPNALDNTIELAEKTDFTMKIGKDKEYIMPSVITKKGMTEAETLRSHVLEGARDPKRYGDEDGNIPDHVMERIDYELEVVDNMGFNGYFLIVENMIKMFAENGIFVGPGRGCLHPDTKVLTQKGLVPITDVKKNDYVITSEGAWSRVLENQQHETSEGEELIVISTADNNSIKLTEKHKVFIEENGTKVWKKAHEILPGDEILSIKENSEEKHVVRIIEKEPVPQYVYDLTIEGDPSFLTDCGTVHNSAPGSVVVYCLGITNLDPFRHDLFFERFLNPDRISMPDIDIDIPKTKRDKALYLLEKEYGEGHVAHLSNYNSMKEKDALRRIAKVFGLSPSETNAFSKTFFEYCEQYGTNVTELAESPVVPSELLESTGVDKDTIRDIIAATDKLAGTIASYGVHACGIVITSTPVDDHFPIRLAKNATLPVCQYDGYDTEDLGGVKMDILGLINLDIAEDTESNILQDRNEEVDSSHLPLDDKETYKTLSSGKSGGIFQMGCLSGDTIIDGSTIKDMYTRRNSSTGTSYIRSVFLGEGYVYANRCMEIIYSGKKDIYSLVVDEGQELKATKDHKVFTQRGWSAIGDLKVGEDNVLYVDEAIGHILPGTVRGRDDIYDIFEMTHPDFEMIAMPEPLTIGHKTFYPKFVNRNDKKHIVHIYPDSAHKYALDVQRETLYDNKGYKIDLYPYSRILEEAYEKIENPEFLLPEGTEWREVVSLSFDKNDDTFDIIMLDPVNNFIANNIMVHNSSGIKSLMKDMKPDNFEDISATIALYRPGPMGMESHTEYARRKNGIKPVEYFHDDAKEVLKDTYGLCVSGDTMIYDADTGIMYRIDSIQEKVSSGMNTIGVRKDGTPVSGKIEAWWCSGEKEIYRLETTEGTIETSGDHPILTGNGWKHVKDITSEDSIGFINNVLINSGIRWVKVTSCVNTGRVKKVYDISVPDIKNFIANGNIVVSNCVYQENIMSIAQEFAHYSGAEADELRKAVGKKIPEKMEEQHQKFIPAVNEHYPDDPDLGQAIWDIIEPFGSYAFNKSHSAAYGMLSYRTAWLKTHYPAQFAGASIDYNMTSKDKIIDTVAWIKEMGVHINHPDVNISQMRTVTSDMEITLPLHIIEGVGDSKAKEFIQEREENGDYESVVDFIARNKVPKNMVLMMAKAGCFDNLGAHRGAVIGKIDEVMSVGNSRKNIEKINSGLFGDVVEDIMEEEVIDLSQPVNRVIDGEKVVDVTTEQLARWEREAVSFIMGTHPFEEFRNMKATQGFISKFEPIDEIKEEIEGINATAMLTNLKNRVSQKQKAYQTFELETDRGIVEALYFGERKLMPSMEDTIVAIRGAKMVADNFNPKGGDEEETTGSETFKVICGSDDQVKTVDIEKFRKKESELEEDTKPVKKKSKKTTKKSSTKRNSRRR